MTSCHLCIHKHAFCVSSINTNKVIGDSLRGGKPDSIRCFSSTFHKFKYLHVLQFNSQICLIKVTLPGFCYAAFIDTHTYIVCCDLEGVVLLTIDWRPFHYICVRLSVTNDILYHTSTVCVCVCSVLFVAKRQTSEGQRGREACWWTVI